MVTTSSNRGLLLPADLGDSSAWGTPLNNTWQGLDQILGGTLVLPASTYGTGTTLTSAQTQSQMLEFMASSGGSGTFTLTFSSTSYGLGKFSITNNSTGQKVLCQSTATGPVVSIPPGQQMQIFSWGNAITTDGMKETVYFNISSPSTSYVIPTMWIGAFHFPWAMTMTDYRVEYIVLSSGTFTVASSLGIWHGTVAQYSSALVKELSVTMLTSTHGVSGNYNAFYNPGDVAACLYTAPATPTQLGFSLQLNGMRYQGSSM